MSSTCKTIKERIKSIEVRKDQLYVLYEKQDIHLYDMYMLFYDNSLILP